MDYGHQPDLASKMSWLPSKSRSLATVLMVAGGSLFATPLLSQNQSSGLVVVPNRMSTGSATAQYQNIVRDVQRTGQTNVQLNSPAGMLAGAGVVSGVVSQASGISSALSDVF